MRELTFSSTLRAAPERVWRHATCPDGVNRELWPLLRMTFPAEAATDGAGAGDLEALARRAPAGERLFRSWILLFGVLPVEYDDLAFAEIEPGRRFLERSTLLTQRVWEHERTVEPVALPAEGGGVDGGGGDGGEATRLTDRVRFEPRVAWLGAVHEAVFRAVFAWRHRRLRRGFGGVGR